MKKPDSKTTQNSSAASKPDEAVPGTAAAKPAAQPGTVVDSKPVPPGAAEKAAAAGGKVKPVDSALLGSDKSMAAAAKKTDSPKAETAPTPLVLPAQDRIDSAEKPSEKPAEKAKADVKPDPVKDVKPDPVKPAEPAKPAPVTRVQKTGFWPVALGGVVAAGLGAAAALWAFPNGLQPAPAVDAEGLKQEILAEVQSGSAQMSDELAQQASAAGAEAARQALADLPPPAEGAGDLQALLDGQAQQIAALTEKLAALEASGGAAGGATSPQLQAQLAEMQAQIQQAAAAAQSQLDSVKAQAEELQQAAASSVQRAEAVAAIARLQGALDQGGPVEEGVQQLEAAGVAAPEALTREVPTLQALQDVYPAASRAALRAVLRDDSAGSNDGGTIIGNFLRAQTGARSVEPRDGADADAILSRAGAALQNGDLATVMTELQALPQIAREAPEMADWMAGAQAHADARAALNDLAGAVPAGPSN